VADESVAGVAADITVPSPRTPSTPYRSGKYDQGADHDHHNCELKKLTELHIRPDTALRLSANLRRSWPAAHDPEATSRLRIVVRHHSAAAVTEGDRPVRVLVH
jgi:hypothetical protein